MGKESAIQWTDATWNVARGCKKVDADCLYCYMYRDSMSETRYIPNEVKKTKTVFDMPLKYKETESKCWDGKPLIFTSSLTDFFIEEIDSYRDEAWDIIRRCPHLIFQILTKRPERIAKHLPSDWGSGYKNVWLGTSIGSQNSIDRIFDLVDSDWHNTQFFLSLEPLHGEIILPPLLLRYFWVIIGGESGNEIGKYRYRPCKIEWIESLVEQCKKANAPVFVKQLGTHLAKELKLSDRHGGDINEWSKFPHLQIRQFPKI